MNAKLLIVLSISFIFLFVSCEDDPPLVLEKGEIVNDIHRDNIGKIAFMKEWVPFKDFTQSDFKQSLTLSEASDFGFRMFLEHSLTYSMSKLAPELSVRELCDKGNFQLTFFVDGKQLYQYNLQTGAGSCDYRNATTVYGIPLKNKAEPDHWGIFLWTKFMKLGGGQKALTPGSHSFRLEVRPYLQMDTLMVGELIAKGEIELNMVEEEVDESKIAIQEIAPTDKFETSDASYDKDLIRRLNERIAQNYFQKITSVVVLKDGKLLIEEYFNGTDRNSLHDTRSVGKSLTSSVMGIAVGDGHIKDENSKLGDFYQLKSYQNHSPGKENVSLKSLLTMSSGFDGSDMDMESPGNEENMYPTSDWVKFGLDLPLDNNKTMGKDWDYFTAGVVLLGDVLNQVVPNGLEAYAAEKLFAPLNIQGYKWQYTPTKVPNTAGGFQMSSLDNARYGQLYLDNGAYKGTQIIPTDWVQASLSHQVAIPDKNNEFYGYLFWNKIYQSADQEYEAYYASGNGGNKIMIFKDMGLVIVLTATAYNAPYMHQQVDEIVADYLLPAVAGEGKD
ncbi:MAG: serine hydrolase [Bacteroidota bacterium]